ncbi:hypothetical protein ASB7_10420 [Helicobacter ailurogastricus]|nr:hypothetical protein ASB7_10420 [Helicobacter ailurogastricus]
MLQGLYMDNVQQRTHRIALDIRRDLNQQFYLYVLIVLSFLLVVVVVPPYYLFYRKITGGIWTLNKGLKDFFSSQITKTKRPQKRSICAPKTSWERWHAHGRFRKISKPKRSTPNSSTWGLISTTFPIFKFHFPQHSNTIEIYLRNDFRAHMDTFQF